ncbi:MAG: glycine betaine ABC transporter substrate-binding protein, partial [Thermoanaerobaculia bacterium]|nr:glycine betaine ABC transporter substrate-binding protein [Thermoanaerobaculia bacterium]
MRRCAQRTLRLVVGCLAAVLAGAAAGGAEPIAIGSKNFAESRLLAEIFAQVIEARTEIPVERRFGLAGTQVCFAALRGGEIDLYPEYTGTGLASILGRSPGEGRRETRALVRREFARRWDLVWLAPLGFENSYELAVPRALAERLELSTLSDLARHAGELTAGLGYEFVERPDGLPGLRRVYGLAFADVRPMQQSLKSPAVAGGRIDVLDVYTTDGRLVTHDLVVLEDDREFFPPYEAAALVRRDTLDRHPAVATALALLAGAFDAA